MISDIDKSGSGTVDFQEFLQMMSTKMSQKDSKEEILKAFKLFDDDETGKDILKALRLPKYLSCSYKHSKGFKPMDYGFLSNSASAIRKS